MARVNMNFPDELLERVDAFAKKNYMNRTAVILFCCNQFLQANEMQSLFLDMRKAMQRIAETGTVDTATQAELEKFSMMCEVFSNRDSEK